MLKTTIKPLALSLLVLAVTFMRMYNTNPH